MTRFALRGADAPERGLLRIDFLTLGMFVFHKSQGQRFLYSKLIPIVENSTILFFRWLRRSKLVLTLKGRVVSILGGP